MGERARVAVELRGRDCMSKDMFHRRRRRRVSESSWNESLENLCSTINQIAPACLFEERTKKETGLPQKHLKWKHLWKKRWIWPFPHKYTEETSVSFRVRILIPIQFPHQKEWWHQMKANVWLLLAQQNPFIQRHGHYAVVGVTQRPRIESRVCEHHLAPQLKWPYWVSVSMD